MRPPEFTGGNYPLLPSGQPSKYVASMRPPEFTGGNDPAELSKYKADGLLQ